MVKKNIEIISGVGDYPSLYAACDAGANAIYFGVKGLNMRDFGKNFTSKDLPNIVNYCHERNVKTYLAINTIVYEKELNLAKKILKEAKKAKVDAVICSDFSVFQEAKKLKIPIHISTQMSISNSEACKFLRKQGAERVVLARELNLKQIKEIRKNSKIEIEIFIHGSMCVAVSGRCFLSLYFHDNSANRGKCTNPCRRVWYLEDDENKDKTVEIYGNRIISSKDLCTIPFFEDIVKLNPHGLKIEGRNKGPDYIYVVTKVYKKALELVQKNKLNKKEKSKLEKELSETFNRGFISGFYFRTPDYNEIQTSKQSKRTKNLICIGRIKNYYSNLNVAEINADEDFKLGEEIVVKGENTYFRQTIESMEIKHKKVIKAKKEQDVAIKLNQKARKNDLIYALR